MGKVQINRKVTAITIYSFKMYCKWRYYLFISSQEISELDFYSTQRNNRISD